MPCPLYQFSNILAHEATAVKEHHQNIGSPFLSVILLPVDLHLILQEKVKSPFPFTFSVKILWIKIFIFQPFQKSFWSSQVWEMILNLQSQDHRKNFSLYFFVREEHEGVSVLPLTQYFHLLSISFFPDTDYEESIDCAGLWKPVLSPDWIIHFWFAPGCTEDLLLQ